MLPVARDLAHRLERFLQLPAVEPPRLVGVDLSEGGAALGVAREVARRLRLLPRDDVAHEPRELGEVEPRVLLLALVPAEDRLGARFVGLEAERLERARELLELDPARA